MKKYSRVDAGTVRIELSALRRLPAAASFRLLQQAVDSTLAKDMPSSQYDQIKSLLKWARSSAGQPLALPKNLAASKDSQHLILTFRKKVPSEKKDGGIEVGYAYRLEVPGSIEDSRLGFRCRAEFVDLGSASEAYNKAGYVLLNQSLLKFPLTLRSWKPGDAYCRHGRHKSRKLKELFQRDGVPRELRPYWPVLESDSRIVWARGFGVAQGFTPQSGAGKAVLFTYSSLNASNGKEREPR
jgi:tRNA(Ile)-lysidine synthase